MSNKIKHLDAWAFYIEHARNISESDISNLGNYRIPEPNKSGNFIYADKVEMLWQKFIISWYKEDINSESVRGKIQYIVNHF